MARNAKAPRKGRRPAQEPPPRPAGTRTTQPVVRRGHGLTKNHRGGGGKSKSQNDDPKLGHARIRWAAGTGPFLVQLILRGRHQAFGLALRSGSNGPVTPKVTRLPRGPAAACRARRPAPAPPRFANDCRSHPGLLRHAAPGGRVTQNDDGPAAGLNERPRRDPSRRADERSRSRTPGKARTNGLARCAPGYAETTKGPGMRTGHLAYSRLARALGLGSSSRSSFGPARSWQENQRLAIRG